MNDKILKPTVEITLPVINESKNIEAFSDGGFFDNLTLMDDQALSDEPLDIDDDDVNDVTQVFMSEPDDDLTANDEANIADNSSFVVINTPKVNTIPIEENQEDNEPDNVKTKVEESKTTAAETVKYKSDVDKQTTEFATIHIDNVIEENKELLNNKAREINGDIKDLKMQSQKKFKNDFFYLNYFKKPGDLEKIRNGVDLISSYTLADKDELWEDPFIQADYTRRFGDDAKNKFNESYSGIFSDYKAAYEQQVNDRQLEGRIFNNKLTGNRAYDIMMADTVEEKEAIAKIYDGIYTPEMKISTVSTHKGSQNIVGGIMGASPYETVIDAARHTAMDEFGNLIDIDSNYIDDVDKNGKWFKMDADIYQQKLTDVGLASFQLFDTKQRQRLDTNVVSAYDIDDRTPFASILRRGTKMELEGIGDYASVFLSSIYRLGIDMLNSGVNMSNALSSAFTGTGIDGSNQFKNTLRKYSVGRTYEAANNMWGLENIYTESVNGLLQLGLAYGIGAGLKGATYNKLWKYKKAPIVAQFGTRATLTMYGVGTVYDEFLDNGFSEEEAGRYSMSAFLGMWMANGLSGWVSKGFASKEGLEATKTFIKGQIVKDAFTIAKDKTLNEVEKHTALYKLFTSTKKILDKASSIKTLAHGSQEGLEEMMENVADEMNKQLANLWTHIDGDNTDRQQFGINNENYWGDWVNETLFAGMLGAITGSIPGAVGDVKRIVNRKIGDVKGEHIKTYEDVLALNNDDQFYSLVVKLHKEGDLGSHDVRYDGTEGKPNDEIISQADFNKAMILNDFLTTKETLGLTKDNSMPNFTPSDANIDVAKKVKETFHKLIGPDGLYIRNDVTHADFIEFSKPGQLKAYNDKRIADGKEAIGASDVVAMKEANNMLNDVRSGEYHKAMFINKALEKNKFFGDKEFRIDGLKDDKFDDLFLKYFKNTMSNAHAFLADIDKDSANLRDHSEEIENTAIKDLPSLIDKLQEDGIITPEDKKILDEKVQEYVEEKEFEVQKTQMELFISSYLKAIDEQFDSVYSKFDLSEIEKKKNDFLLKVEGSKQLTKEENNFLRFSKGRKVVSDMLNDIDDENIADAFDSMEFDMYNPEEVISLGLSVENIPEGTSLTEFYSLIERQKDAGLIVLRDVSIPKVSMLKAEISNIKAQANNLKVDTIEGLERKKTNDINFLEQLGIVLDSGEIRNSPLTLSQGMIDYIDEMLMNIPKATTSEEKKQAIIEVQQSDKVEQMLQSLVVHQQFLGAISENLQHINSINRIIERTRSNEFLTRKFSFVDDTIAGRIFRNFMWFKTPDKYTLNNKFINPSMTEDAFKINKEISRLNTELSNDKLTIDQQDDIKKQIEILKGMIPYNVFDKERFDFLEDKANKTLEENTELSDMKEKRRLLEAPSEKLITFLNSVDSVVIFENNEKIAAAEKEISEIEKEIQGLESGRIKAYDEVDYYSKRNNINDVNNSIDLLNDKKSILSSKVDELKKSNESIAEQSNKVANVKLEELLKKDKEYKSFINNPNIPEDVRNMMIAQESPISNFIYEKLNNKFDNIQDLLIFVKEFYNDGKYTIIDRAEISKAVMKIMQDQGEKLAERGVGANYEKNIKTSVGDLFSMINTVFSNKDDLFKCK